MTMDKEQLEKLVSGAIEQAMNDKMTFLDIITVLESCKMSVAIIVHESARREGIFNK